MSAQEKVIAYIKEKGGKLKTPQHYFMLCPFHKEENPSFSYSIPKEYYYCFGCGKHGSGEDFINELHLVGYKA